MNWRDIAEIDREIDRGENEYSEESRIYESALETENYDVVEEIPELGDNEIEELREIRRDRIPNSKHYDPHIEVADHGRELLNSKTDIAYSHKLTQSFLTRNRDQQNIPEDGRSDKGIASSTIYWQRRSTQTEISEAMDIGSNTLRSAHDDLKQWWNNSSAEEKP